jgi:hypothetical protein
VDTKRACWRRLRICSKPDTFGTRLFPWGAGWLIELQCSAVLQRIGFGRSIVIGWKLRSDTTSECPSIALPEEQRVRYYFVGQGGVMPTDDAELFFKMYCLAVEMADRTSARRAGANTFFVTLNTTLVAISGLMSNAGRPGGETAKVALVFGRCAVVIAGIVVAFAWWALLRYYRRLSSAKFIVIIGLEQRLPTQPYSEEWNLLHARGPRGEHLEATIVEQVVPCVFVLLYCALGIRAIVW